MDDVQTYPIKLGLSSIFDGVLCRAPLWRAQYFVPNLEVCISSEGNEWIGCHKFAKRGHLRLKLLQAINYPQPSLFAKLIWTNPQSTNIYITPHILQTHEEGFLLLNIPHPPVFWKNMAIFLGGKHPSKNLQICPDLSFPMQRAEKHNLPNFMSSCPSDVNMQA